MSTKRMTIRLINIKANIGIKADINNKTEERW